MADSCCPSQAATRAPELTLLLRAPLESAERGISMRKQGELKLEQLDVAEGQMPVLPVGYWELVQATPDESRADTRHGQQVTGRESRPSEARDRIAATAPNQTPHHRSPRVWATGEDIAQGNFQDSAAPTNPKNDQAVLGCLVDWQGPVSHCGEAIAPSQILCAPIRYEFTTGSGRRTQFRQGFGHWTGENIGCGVAEKAFYRPPLGGYACRQHARQASERSNRQLDRESPKALPSQLEVAGQAVGIRGVEDEADPLAAKLVDGMVGELGEYSLSLEVWMCGGIDGPDSPHHLTIPEELPSQESSKPNDNAFPNSDPPRGCPEWVSVVFPSEMFPVAAVRWSAERRSQQGPYGLLIPGLDRADIHSQIRYPLIPFNTMIRQCHFLSMAHGR